MYLSIGGPGKIVQIDESKFGKQKKTRGKRGHRAEGEWVFGGTEAHSDKHRVGYCQLPSNHR